MYFSQIAHAQALSLSGVCLRTYFVYLRIPIFSLSLSRTNAHLVCVYVSSCCRLFLDSELTMMIRFSVIVLVLLLLDIILLNIMYNPIRIYSLRFITIVPTHTSLPAFSSPSFLFWFFWLACSLALSLAILLLSLSLLAFFSFFSFGICSQKNHPRHHRPPLTLSRSCIRAVSGLTWFNCCL